MVVNNSASIFELVGTTGGGVVVVEPRISNQLKFHPPLACVVTTLKVCAPAGSVTWAETVCQFWNPLVLGTVMVAKTAPVVLLNWNCGPLKIVATRKLTV